MNNYLRYYNQYRDLRQRRFNPNNHQYQYCCDLEFEWPTYRDFIISIESHIGERPTPDHVLTRRQWDLGFVTDNMTWSLRKSVAQRQRTVKPYLYRGRRRCLVEIAEMAGVSIHRLRKRLHRGQELKAALRDIRKKPFAR